MFLLYVGLCTILASKHYLHHSIGLDWHGSPRERRSSLTPHHAPFLHRCRRVRQRQVSESALPSVPLVVGDVVRVGCHRHGRSWSCAARRCHVEPWWCAAGRVLRQTSLRADERDRLPPMTTRQRRRHRFLHHDRLPPTRTRRGRHHRFLRRDWLPPTRTHQSSLAERRVLLGLPMRLLLQLAVVD